MYVLDFIRLFLPLQVIEIKFKKIIVRHKVTIMKKKQKKKLAFVRQEFTGNKLAIVRNKVAITRK